MYYISEDEIKLILRSALGREPAISEIEDFKSLLDKTRLSWLRNNAKALHYETGKLIR